MKKKTKRERTIAVYDEGGSLEAECEHDEAEDADEVRCVLTDAEVAFNERKAKLEAEIASRSVSLARLKSQAKIESDALKLAVDELAEHERQGPECLPLFDQPAGVDATQTPWRGLPIATLRLSAVIEKAMADSFIYTLGELFDLMQRYGVHWNEQVRGIGPEHALTVADAFGDFWNEHPEYSAQAQEEEAP